MTRRSSIVFFLFMLTGSTVYGQDKKPFDVYHELEQIESSLTTLIYSLGKIPRDKVSIDVSNVSPREVYCLARLMTTKSNIILGHYTDFNIDLPPNPVENMTPTDVFVVSDLTNVAIEKLLQYHNISYQEITPFIDESKTPTDVFKLAFNINRWLNQLLPEKTQPRHVYDQVATANSIVRIFLQQFGLTETEKVAITKGHRPKDVVDQLQKSYQVLEKMALAHDYDVMHMEVTSASMTTEPADAYDWATIIEYQLTYMYSVSSNVRTTPPSLSKSMNKSPDDVFQQACELENGLKSVIRTTNIN